MAQELTIPQDFLINDDNTKETLFSCITFPEDTFNSTSINLNGWFLLYTPFTGEVKLYNKYYTYKNYQIAETVIEKETGGNNIINYVFSKYKSFGLEESLKLLMVRRREASRLDKNIDKSDTVLISFDKPSLNKNSDTTNARFHRDAHFGRVGDYFWNPPPGIKRQKIISVLGQNEFDFFSHFTCIQYFPETSCVSTTIDLTPDPNTAKLPASENIVRYRVCKGTMLCINNRRFTHSTPYMIGKHQSDNIDRSIGDRILAQNVQDEHIDRFLCRLQFTVLENPLEINDNDFYTYNVKEHLEQIIPKNIRTAPLSEYLKSSRDLEVGGGNIKDKTHIKYNNKRYKVYYEKDDKKQRYISSKATGKVLLSSIRGKYRYTS